MRIKVNDIVKVITGDDSGETGKVLSVDHESGRLIVEGVNRVYKHVRRSQKNPQGGRLSKEMPIQASNVMLVCSKCGQAARTEGSAGGHSLAGKQRVAFFGERGEDQ